MHGIVRVLDHRLSHLYNAGMSHVVCSTTRQTLRARILGVGEEVRACCKLSEQAVDGNFEVDMWTVYACVRTTQAEPVDRFACVVEGAAQLLRQRIVDAANRYRSGDETGWSCQKPARLRTPAMYFPHGRQGADCSLHTPGCFM